MKNLFSRVIAVMFAISAIPATANADWTEGFESYADGTQLYGVGGWDGWYGTQDAAAYVTNTQAYEGANSVLIGPTTDAVHPFSAYTSGNYAMDFQMLLNAADHAGNAYFIVNNEYSADGTGTTQWSSQLQFQTNGDLLFVETGDTLAINYDAWTNIHIDFDFDNNLQTVYYNGTELGSKEIGDPSALANIDLYSEGATFYFDNFNISAVPEPTSGIVLLLGATCLGVARRRRNS